MPAAHIHLQTPLQRLAQTAVLRTPARIEADLKGARQRRIQGGQHAIKLLTKTREVFLAQFLDLLARLDKGMSPQIQGLTVHFTMLEEGISLSQRTLSRQPRREKTRFHVEQPPVQQLSTLNWRALHQLQGGGVHDLHREQTGQLRHSGKGFTVVAHSNPTILPALQPGGMSQTDRKSTRLNSSHVAISYAVFCLKKKKTD